MPCYIKDRGSNIVSFHQSELSISINLTNESGSLGCPLGARFSEFGVLHQKIMVIGMILEGLYLRFSHFNAFSKTGHPLDLEGKLIKIY